MEVDMPTFDLISGYVARSYNQLAVPLLDFQDPNKSIIHAIRSTLREWRNGSRRRDHFLFRKSDNATNGAMQGLAVVKAEMFFEIRDPIVGFD